MFGIATQEQLNDIMNHCFDNDTRLEKCEKKIEDLRNSVESLKTMPSLGTDYAQRLIEVEAKLGKLWSMLVEVSPTTGKEKLTKIGRRFGGKSGTAY